MLGKILEIIKEKELEEDDMELDDHGCGAFDEPIQ